MKADFKEPSLIQAPAELVQLRLSALVECDRAIRLSTYYSYFKGSQYNARLYDWDGFRVPLGAGDADIKPGFVVPMKNRRPSTRIDQARKTVRRFTAMVFGEGRFPEVNVHGDADAEDWCNELIRVSKLESKMIEARNKGGAMGTSVLSWVFVDGKPRVTVHNARFVTVLRWLDKDERTVGAAVECYAYKRPVLVEEKLVERVFYYVRFWDENVEAVWQPIPEPMAKDGTWATTIGRVEVRHNYGFAPVYWIQNQPDSDSDDGESDYDGLLPLFDDMSKVASQTTKGTIANLDPTLVVKDDSSKNQGTLRKGSENVIYAKDGADYLELQGTAVAAAKEWLAELRNEASDVANVVFPDPNQIAAKVQSAAALRIIYGPMLTQCGVYRIQYGDGGLVRIVRDMLEISRRVMESSPSEVITTVDGQRFQQLSTIQLEPRTEDKVSESGEVTTEIKQRSPGKSSNVTLNWPPYFPNTWTDTAAAVEATSKAVGGKQVISRETAVKTIGPMFGAYDTQDELKRIQEDEEEALDNAVAQQTMVMDREAELFPKPAPKGEE